MEKLDKMKKKIGNNGEIETLRIKENARNQKHYNRN